MNLREKDRVRIIALAEKYFITPVEIWAYGSRVNGDSHDGSDLDLVIRTQNLLPINGSELLNFQEGLRDSNIPILVEAKDWSRLPDAFKKNILKRYEILFSNIQISETL